MAMAVIWISTINFVIYRYRGERIASRLVAGADIRHQRIIGSILLGIIPAVSLVLVYDANLLALGLGVPRVSLTGFAYAGVLLIAVPLIHRQAQNESYWSHYPELRLEPWSRHIWLSNAATWALYLLAYELLFRGLLLMSLQQWLGTWPAIGIVTAMYVLSHVDKSAEETFGTIPMSIIFAGAALSTDSIWLPWMIHVSIAVASDSFAVRAKANS